MAPEDTGGGGLYRSGAEERACGVVHIGLEVGRAASDAPGLAMAAVDIEPVRVFSDALLCDGSPVEEPIAFCEVNAELITVFGDANDELGCDKAPEEGAMRVGVVIAGVLRALDRDIGVCVVIVFFGLRACPCPCTACTGAPARIWLLTNGGNRSEFGTKEGCAGGGH